MKQRRSSSFGSSMIVNLKNGGPMTLILNGGAKENGGKG
jgi:D-Tyr-tRNAtyr deacylase